MVPSPLAGVDIGFSIAPATSAVMATVPSVPCRRSAGCALDDAADGHADGYRRLGAILQGRIARNAHVGVTELSGVPAAVGQQVVAEIGSVEQMVAGLPVQYQNTVFHAVNA